MKHTKEPWELGEYHNETKTTTFTGPYFDILAKNGYQQPALSAGINEEQAKANAERIVTCVNNHDELLEACKYVVQYHRENDSGEGELFGLDFVTTCIAAIRKVEDSA